MEELISVIMSTYNEELDELEKSIESILNQTYHNLEFIIVIDNPDNREIINHLNSLTDSRIKIIKNEFNIGLVDSLNKALKVTRGKYIARMDADDISYLNRLSAQINYIKNKNVDIVGGCIDIIDEHNKFIKKLNFPSSHNMINYFLRWGNCVPHPTWLIKKDVYIQLKGYRNVPRCEDYDFICRAVQKGFKLGNISECVLKYRIRGNSISNSNKSEQYIVRRFISKNRKYNIEKFEIDRYINSNKFKEDIELYRKFQDIKELIKKEKTINNFIKLIGNKYTYYLLIEKIGLKIRNIL